MSTFFLGVMPWPAAGCAPPARPRREQLSLKNVLTKESRDPSTPQLFWQGERLDAARRSAGFLNG